MSQLLAQIQDLQNKVNSLSDARELYDPESGSSSGATHVPSQPSTIPSPRTLSRCARYTEFYGYYRKRSRTTTCSWRTILHSSTIQRILASSSHELRPGTTGTTRRQERVKWKENRLNTSIPLPHFQSGGGMLNRTGGTYSHSGAMDYLRFPISELHVGKISWLHGIPKLECQLQEWVLFEKKQIFISQCGGSMLDAMVASAMKKLLKTQIHFRKRVSVRRAACSKTRPILKRETNCLHDLRAFPCNRSLWSGTRTQICSVYVCGMIMSKISTLDGIKHYYHRAKCLQMWSWKDCTSQNYSVLFSFRLRWLCTIKKTARNNGKPNYSQLKTAVKLHTDQMMKTRNFRVRNEVVERGSVSKRQKVKKAYVERIVGVFSVEGTSFFSQETHVVSVVTK